MTVSSTASFLLVTPAVIVFEKFSLRTGMLNRPKAWEAPNRTIHQSSLSQCLMQCKQQAREVLCKDSPSVHILKDFAFWLETEGNYVKLWKIQIIKRSGHRHW